ncbi:RagB/SusD family nutrient uptake outer membrane protein [Draconibacterium sp. IB214405]|uniref:RagB/SusD family nutrient uptake outer membrane protein n=1 Tax=Draconibacterium sp. IB214405 TaxID=3097352 RepID=UPI002A0E9F3D|nr:RagB/SusD family nutrient uptake outer membrane protein [Draconibacterium sp. IB214405]MDX8338055.1 RagB/SusD family nutrient uptake outer membrane protein [Draconibacterium sp. IB214405]
MKNLLFILVFAISLLLMSCEDFLDTTNYTKKDTSNYPETVTDAEQMITGIYSNLSYSSASPHTSYYYAAELASDDRFGGGGENDKLMQALDLMMNNGSSMLEEFWRVRYTGIFRANMAIETLDNCEGYESEDQRNQMKGEAYFMRAFFYHEMASFYGQVPLVVTTAAVNLPKASPEEIYAQIASDLKMAIELMPSKPYTSVSAGHATKWTAEALMARVFLFYTGFYSKDALPLVGEDGTVSGSVSKSEVISWVEDCINNSGHELVADFRELWPYTNAYTVDEYEFTKEQGLEWVEDNNGVNPETMFAIKYSNFPDWGTTIGYSNQYALHFGLRGGQNYENTFPFGQGWGAGPVVPTIWNEWVQAEPTDTIRREGSIINIPAELPNYAKGGWADFIQETDYWNKKMVPVTARNESGTLASSYSVLMYGTEDNMQLDNTMDLILIRYADVLLMHSELTETNTYMNQVRARAGLDGKEYSLANIQKERRWELAFEGVRWNDIRRWGIAATELEKQIGQPIYTKGNDDMSKGFGGGYASRYEATNGGFFPIPESQIYLSDGVLEQNAGWGTAAAEYTGWK